jgi:hypothetical protein
MHAVRHHTVPRFLPAQFGSDSAKGQVRKPILPRERIGAAKQRHVHPFPPGRGDRPPIGHVHTRRTIRSAPHHADDERPRQ